MFVVLKSWYLNWWRMKVAQTLRNSPWKNQFQIQTLTAATLSLKFSTSTSTSYPPFTPPLIRKVPFQKPPVVASLRNPFQGTKPRPNFQTNFLLKSPKEDKAARRGEYKKLMWESRTQGNANRVLRLMEMSRLIIQTILCVLCLFCLWTVFLFLFLFFCALLFLVSLFVAIFPLVSSIPFSFQSPPPPLTPQTKQTSM